MIRFSFGSVGCVTGDTLINVNRCKKGFQSKISYMYKMFHNDYKDKTKVWNLDRSTYVRSYDGERIKLHKIEDVVFSGIKNVYMLSLSNGLFIEATADHKIMTDKGFIELLRLNKHCNVMIDTLKPQKGNKKSYKLADININGGWHPWKNKIGKIEVHRLIYEAYINNLKFIDYLDILWNDKPSINKYKFINPNLYIIHHVDGNHYNNHIFNLECVPRLDHFKHHGITENFRNFNQGIPEFIEVDSIKQIGLKKTYDIICEDPYRNFVGNGIVIHNSGKTCARCCSARTGRS